MISIIIPTYNRAKFLPRAIESVQKQTNEDWELIISDDGSTDNTEEVVSKYLDDVRIKYIKNKNAGATAARNSGAKLAKYDFITFLDSDDEAKPTWLENLYREIRTGGKVICCGYDYIDHNGHLLRTNLPKQMGPLYGNRIGRFTNGGVFVLQKELFEEVGGYDEKVRSGQHSELAIRLVEYMDKHRIGIRNIFIPLIKVHVHKGAKIRNDDRAIYDGTVYTLEKHRHLFEANKKLYIDYLKVGAVSAYRLGEISEAQVLFFKAWRLNMLKIKSFGQLLISFIPILGTKVWNQAN